MAPQARAVRGLEAAAFVLRHAVDAYAVAGGEGARRLGVALAQFTQGPTRLAGEGLDAARAAVGHAAAGKRTALIVSGDGVLEALPAIRELARTGIPALLVIPSHGSDIGGTLPQAGLDDIVPLQSLAVGILVASDASQVADLLLAGLRAASDRGAPWAVAFELGAVGLALSNTRLPEVEVVKQWVANLAMPTSEHGSLPPPDRDLERYQRDVERFSFAVGAAMRDLERQVRHTVAPVIFEGARDPEVVFVAAGSAARAARQAAPHVQTGGVKNAAAIQVTSLRPFPAAEVVRLAWRARAVIVHEPHPEPLGVGGTLSDAVRASFADALTWHPGFAGIGRIPPVVTVLGDDVTAAQWLALAEQVAQAGDPPRLVVADKARTGSSAPEARIEIVMAEAERENALRLIVDWLARTNVTVSAHAHEPTRASLALARATDARGPSTVLLVCSGAPFEPARLESLPASSVVVLAGDFPDRVLADTMRACAPRGIRVATLHPQGGALRSDAALAATVGALLPGLAGEAFETAAKELAGADATAVLAQTRAFGEALRGQFG